MIRVEEGRYVESTDTVRFGAQCIALTAVERLTPLPYLRSTLKYCDKYGRFRMAVPVKNIVEVPDER